MRAGNRQSAIGNRALAALAACLVAVGCLGVGPGADGPGTTGDPTPPRPPGIVAPAISTSSLPTATTGQAYSATMQAIGGAIPYRWTVTSGSLPPGLTLDLTQGYITGTPTTTGIFPFDVNLATPYGSVAKSLTLEVQ